MVRGKALEWISAEEGVVDSKGHTGDCDKSIEG
jgi:hypothetical protein